MKRPSLIIIATLLTLITSGQTLISFGNFPPTYNDTSSLKTTDLLDRINWQGLKRFCDTAKGHYTYERKKGLLTTFSYVEQGYVAFFEIISYNGFVLESNFNLPNSTKPTSSDYFDKRLWLQYVHDVLPNIKTDLQLPTTETKTVLKAYYELLGVNTNDEYGWICEYGTVGKVTARRMAVIELLKYNRIDLLKKLTSYSNIQTQLYAVDAIIYNDYELKSKISTSEKKIIEIEKQIQALKKESNADQDQIADLQNQIKSDKDFIKYMTRELLSKSEWQLIYQLRDSKKTVITCGNSGSYKTYQTPVAELLSPNAIADIPRQYDALKDMGYFR